MTEPNPFEKVEAEARAASAKHLAIAEALDKMEEDVTSWEADFLNSILIRLRGGGALSQRQIDSLNRMSDKYEVG